MKPKDIFGLAVRILGLVLLYHLLLAAPAIIASFIGGRVGGILFRSACVVAALFVIWWLIGGAPTLMERAYPENKKDEPGSR